MVKRPVLSLSKGFFSTLASVWVDPETPNPVM